MKTGISIRTKPEVKPRGPTNLETMKPYRVVSIREGFTETEAGDIVLSFPSNTGGTFVLNCTRQKMFFDRSTSGRNWDSDFQCLRAFDVEKIFFAVDHEDRPQDKEQTDGERSV